MSKSNAFRITKISIALVMTAGFAACDDLPAPSRKVTTPIAAAPPSPAELPSPPPPVAMPMPTPAPTPTPATDTQPKLQPVAAKGDDDGDQKVEPSEALAGARKLLAVGNGEGALRLAKVAVLRTPKRSSAWNTLGRAQLVLGKRKDAITSFEKAVELDPQSSYARNNLGLALIYDKRYDEAVDALEQAVELEPVEAYMWNNLGMAYEQLDRLEDARDAYDKAVTMDSDRAGASLNRLKGVKSVVRTARIETTRIETPAPTDTEAKDSVSGKTDEATKDEPSATP
jgi:tetratricopeptide (TPR) repeat protein